MVVKPNVVYILVCKNEKFKGRVYVGYTVDPVRRLKQHNKGKEFGGAYRTNNKGPWEMVLFVSGFPNEISALRFEWTLQHPARSRRINDLRKKKRNESLLQYHLFILENMLNIGPWNRLPLRLHWLNDEQYVDKLISVPEHVQIRFGVEIPEVDTLQLLYEEECLFCFSAVNEAERTLCLNRECSMTSHFVCLAKYIIGDSFHVVPTEKHCPLCDETIVWGDIVKVKTNSFKE